MNYTSVEVLQDLPELPEGLYPFPEGGWFITDNCRYNTKANWFRLISEPSFEVGGYAKCLTGSTGKKPAFKAGNIYKIIGFGDRGFEDALSFERDDNGIQNGFNKSYFTPSTEAEYLAQEEAKKPWKPERTGERFYYINLKGAIDDSLYSHRWEDNIGMFRTREAAKYFLENFWKPAFEKYAQDYATLPEEVK